MSDPGAPSAEKVQEIRGRANMIRRETIRLIDVAGSGHYTSVYSAAEVLATLYSGVMRLAEDPDWPERDRLILSKGHVAVGVYPLLAERGYIAQNGHCASLDELISSNSLAMARPERDGYSYSIECSGGDFSATARHAPAAAGSPIRYPTLAIDQNMQVREVN